MKTKVLKLSGSLALMALFVGSFASKANVQPVSVDDVQITQAGNFDDLLGGRGDWTFISSDYVYKGTK